MPEELPVETIYDLSRVGRPNLSPDGDRVAFTVTEADPDEDEQRTSVFVAPADGSREPHRLTRVSDAGGIEWSPDGSKLGVVMARQQDVELKVGRDEDDEDDEDAETDAQDEEGGDGDDAAEEDDEDGPGGPPDEGPKPQVWVYDLEYGGDARQVTDREHGVADFDWGPDGERIVVAARDPTDEEEEYLDQVEDDGPIEIERLQHKFEGAGYLDEVTSYLFVVDVESRESERLDDARGGGLTEVRGGLSPAWSPDGERIAFRSYRGENPDDTHAIDVYTIGPDGADCRRVTDGDLLTGGPEWGPDGDHLAFSGGDPENFYVPSDVYVADRDGAYWSITAGSDRHLGYSNPRFVDAETLVWTVGDHGQTRLARNDVAGEDAPEGVLAARDRYTAVRAPDVAGDTVAVHRSRHDEGSDIFTVDVAALDAGEGADPWTRVTGVNADLLAERDAPGCRRVTFESEGAEGDDPAEVEAIAYYPDDFDPDDPDPRPFVLKIHGGPMAYDEPSFRFEDWFFTSRGYVLWKVNYRGSTSYGAEFSEVLKGRWNSVEVADLLAGTAAAVERGWADPDRLFVTGFSQGGVNTGYLVTHTDRFAAAAAEHGIYDARSCFGTDDSHNWWEDDFGLPWENPEAYHGASAITDVDEVDTPTLITAGENDWRCPPTQAEQFYVSIRKQGVPAKLVVYQNEHHNVGDPERAIHRLEALLDWFERHDPTTESDDAEAES